MMAPLPVNMVWDAKLVELVASLASAVALWAQSYIRKAADPVADLTTRLRHPVRWAAKHPVQALRRLR